jgi:hypothetical protein
MQTYIVRIFRQDRDKRPVLGDVEVAGIDVRTTFHSQAELCRILCGKDRDAPAADGGGARRAGGQPLDSQ